MYSFYGLDSVPKGIIISSLSGRSHLTVAKKLGRMKELVGENYGLWEGTENDWGWPEGSNRYTPKYQFATSSILTSSPHG